MKVGLEKVDMPRSENQRRVCDSKPKHNTTSHCLGHLPAPGEEGPSDNEILKVSMWEKELINTSLLNRKAHLDMKRKPFTYIPKLCTLLLVLSATASLYNSVSYGNLQKCYT